MKHITTEYGQPTNLLECSSEEFRALRNFLLDIGVECRTVKIYGDQYTIQARNNYRDNCIVFGHLSGEKIKQMSEQEIEDGSWRR